MQVMNEQLGQELHEIRFPVKKRKVETVISPRKKEEKLVPIRFDPKLDMGNLYQYGTPMIRDPVLQGGQRKII